jgi:hypothetical protein
VLQYVQRPFLKITFRTFMTNADFKPAARTRNRRIRDKGPTAHVEYRIARLNLLNWKFGRRSARRKFRYKWKFFKISFRSRTFGGRFCDRTSSRF